MSPPTPSALTRRELDRRGWPYTDGQHYQYLGDPADRGRREVLIWCRRRLEELRARIGDGPGWSAGQLVAEVLAEIADKMPAERAGPPGVRRDLFGCGDFLVLDGKPGSLLIQATSTPNVSGRLAKIRGLPDAGSWIAAGNRIEVWGWRSEEDTKQATLFRGAPKARRVRYALSVRAVTLTDFPERMRA